MKKFTHNIYAGLVIFYNSLPNILKRKILFLTKTLRIPNNKFYKDIRYTGELNVKLNNKELKLISTGGTIENKIFWKGIDNSLEPETIWIWKYLSLLPETKTVLDIGANTGIYSLISKCLDNRSQVYAFEPSKHIFQKLQRNILLNKYDIIAKQIAISNVSTKVIFYDVDNENQTTSTLSVNQANHLKQKHTITEYQVDSITIDSFVIENKILSVDLIKIDVETHELEVFEGMKQTISNFQPFIIFEVLTTNIAIGLSETLIKNNYLLFEFIKNNDDYKIREIEILEARPYGNWNFFACHRNKKDIIKDICR